MNFVQQTHLLQVKYELHKKIIGKATDNIYRFAKQFQTPQFAIEKWRFAKQIQIPEFTIDMLQSDRAKNSPALQHLQVDLQTNIKFNNFF